MQRDSGPLVPAADDGHGIRRQIGRPRHFWDDPAIGSPELKLAVRLAFYLVALLVDRAMVASAEQGEVSKRGGPPLGPVTDVVTLREAPMTPREAAAVVPMLKRAA